MVENQITDIFISHASEDKDLLAQPLAHYLERLGYSVWYDQFSLKLGDKLRRSIDKGLRSCRYGVVILSKHFFEKEWPQWELDALLALETLESRKIILPIWHGIDVTTVKTYSPILSDRYAISTVNGIESVGEAIHQVLTVETTEACGVFGIYGKANAFSIVYDGLLSIQSNRVGYARIISSNDSQMQTWEGLTGYLLQKSTIKKSHSLHAVGSANYVQPVSVDNIEHIQDKCQKTVQAHRFRGYWGEGGFAGDINLKNRKKIEKLLEYDFRTILWTKTDIEKVAALIAGCKVTWPNVSLQKALSCLEGAYAFLMLTSQSLIAACDSFGLKHLYIGRLEDASVVSSTHKSIIAIGGEYIRQLAPGEIICVNSSGVASLDFVAPSSIHTMQKLSNHFNNVIFNETHKKG